MPGPRLEAERGQISEPNNSMFNSISTRLAFAGGSGSSAARSIARRSQAAWWRARSGIASRRVRDAGARAGTVGREFRRTKDGGHRIVSDRSLFGA
jgi:hypothetical protein